MRIITSATQTHIHGCVAGSHTTPTTEQDAPRVAISTEPRESLAKGTVAAQTLPGALAVQAALTFSTLIYGRGRGWGGVASVSGGNSQGPIFPRWRVARGLPTLGNTVRVNPKDQVCIQDRPKPLGSQDESLIGSQCRGQKAAFGTCPTPLPIPNSKSEGYRPLLRRLGWRWWPQPLPRDGQKGGPGAGRGLTRGHEAGLGGDAAHLPARGGGTLLDTQPLHFSEISNQWKDLGLQCQAGYECELKVVCEN